MNIENNKLLFYVCAGLTASGSDGYDHGDGEVAALASQIRSAGFDSDLTSWFAKARTGQIAVNPYWPRGSMLAAACFFIDENYTFDADSFFAFTSDGASDPVGAEDFESWILELPRILRKINDHPKIGSLWEGYCRIVEARSPGWLEMAEKAVSASLDFLGSDAPVLAFSPNLFTPYSADFVHIGNHIITIASAPDAETMLHETLHTEVAKHREAIMAYAKEHGLASFADAGKMTEFGYMQDDSAASAAHVIEECFVRALSVLLAGGSEKRLAFHAKYGCLSVPFIASCLQNAPELSANALGGIVAAVLDEIGK